MSDENPCDAMPDTRFALVRPFLLIFSMAHAFLIGLYLWIVPGWITWIALPIAAGAVASVLFAFEMTRKRAIAVMASSGIVIIVLSPVIFWARGYHVSSAVWLVVLTTCLIGPPALSGVTALMFIRHFDRWGASPADG